MQTPGSPFSKITFDFDGDREADKVVFLPENGTWYELLTGGGTSAAAFGASTDKIVPADYDAEVKPTTLFSAMDFGIFCKVQITDFLAFNSDTQMIFPFRRIMTATAKPMSRFIAGNLVCFGNNKGI